MRLSHAIAIVALISGCSGTSVPGPTTIYVDGKASGALKDGSRERPFATIGEAVAVAKPGDSIHVMPGQYSESVLIEIAPLTLRGEAVQGSAERVVVTPPVGQAGVMINDPGGGVPEKVAIENIDVSGASIAGIWIERRMAEIRNCRVENTKKVMTNEYPEPVFGFGVLITNGAHLSIRDGEISLNEGGGLLCVRSKVDVAESTIEGNREEGVRLEGCWESSLLDNTVVGNAVAGIAMLSSTVTVRRNTVSDTVSLNGVYGDGIVVSSLDSPGDPFGPWEVDVSDNNVSRNVRTGILLAAGAMGVVARNDVRENAIGGIWVQGPSGGTDMLRISENRLLENRYVSIHLYGGARAWIERNEIEKTLTGLEIEDVSTIYINHGISVFKDSYGRIEDNRFGSIEPSRAEPETVNWSHILIQGAAEGTALRGNRTDSAPSLRIAIQHQEESKPLDPPTSDQIREANNEAEVRFVPINAPIEFPSSSAMKTFLGVSDHPAVFE